MNYSKERLFEDIKGLYRELRHKDVQKTTNAACTSFVIFVPFCGSIEIVKEHNVCEY